MAWGLNLADLKQIAWNSIQYSTLPQTRREIGLIKWKNQWDLFIDATSNLACHLSVSQMMINVSNILPSYGPFNQSINVTLYGMGYEKAICQQIICRFGDIKTNGILVDINEIICPTPNGNNRISSVPVSLIINDEIIPTGHQYRYLPYVTIIDDGALDSIVRSKSDKMTIPNRILFTVDFSYFSYKNQIRSNLSILHILSLLFKSSNTNRIHLKVRIIRMSHENAQRWYFEFEIKY